MNNERGILFGFILALSIVKSYQQAEKCNLFCGKNGGTTSEIGQGPIGRPGKMGPAGPPGNLAHCNCNLNVELEERLGALETENLRLKESCPKKVVNRSCKEIVEANTLSGDGVYTIQDRNGIEYPVYCDMTNDGGGWTLVATIHENSIGEGIGKCTVGDKWSSEQGNLARRPRGEENWENRNTFGRLVSAASDDYKNSAYFELQAENIMIWQTLKNAPISEFNTSSYLQYRTTNNFLSRYGGNLFHLYSDHFPITPQAYDFPTDSGPSIPVVFDRGDEASILQHFPTNAKPEVEPGYIQFRAISTHRDAFALCPGVRNKPTFLYPSQSCLGSSGHTAGATYCGDFSGLFHDGAPEWTADETLLNSVFMIFYR